MDFVRSYFLQNPYFSTTLSWFSSLDEKMSDQESDWGDIWNLNYQKHEIDKVAKGKRWLTDDDSMRNDFLSIMTTKS